MANQIVEDETLRAKGRMFDSIANFFGKATTVLIMVADKIAHDAAKGE